MKSGRKVEIHSTFTPGTLLYGPPRESKRIVTARKSCNLLTCHRYFDVVEEEEDALNLKSSVLVCLPQHGGRDLPALFSIAPYWDLVASIMKLLWRRGRNSEILLLSSSLTFAQSLVGQMVQHAAKK